MKDFRSFINETLQIKDLEELESAADLFQFGIEKGYYNRRQSDEFNTAYWKVKNKCLAYMVYEKVKGNVLDIIDIVATAPAEVKNDNDALISYVNGRFKALKGKITGLK